MTRIKTGASKSSSYISVNSECDKIEKQEEEHASCMTHGPSQTPHLDRELQKPQAKEILHVITTALNNIADEKQCTKCTLQSTSTLLTSHARDIRAVKHGEWSKEDRKTLKAELKGLFKGVKKDAKGLWKEGK